MHPHLIISLFTPWLIKAPFNIHFAVSQLDTTFSLLNLLYNRIEQEHGVGYKSPIDIVPTHALDPIPNVSKFV